MSEIEPAGRYVPDQGEPTSQEGLEESPLWKDLSREAAHAGLGMVPVAGPALQTIASFRAKRMQERRIRMLEETARQLRMGLDELAARVRDHEAAAELLLRAWVAAGDARSEGKLRVLSTVLAAAIAGERLDIPVAHILVSVAEQLEPLHLQVLADIDVLAKEDPPPQEDGSPGVAGARREALEARLRLPADVVGMVVSDLQSKHIVRNAYDGTWGGLDGLETFRLTELGEAVRDVLLAEGND